MSNAYVSWLKKKEPGLVKIRVFQMHPDYGCDPDDLLIDFGGMAILGWAFSSTDPLANRGHTRPGARTPIAASARVASAVGSDPFGVAADELPSVKVSYGDLIRSRWNDENRDERLAQAGLAGRELTPDVVVQISGEIELAVEDPDGFFDDLPLDAEWTY